ncbi:MAG TPA: transglycosylase domain-containing protein, partial [Enhygromyxa sp.]|nr:transglycosylase domain-containing protein [Enhygromyxa sp.]
MFVALIGVGLGGRAAYRYFAGELPDLASVSSYRELAPGVTRIHSADGTLLAELAREHRSYARLEDVPEPLIQAFLSAEDRRFFDHEGLDFRGLARALKANVQSGTVVQGGSTITQQVAKSFLDDQERTLERKIREAILSVRMESRLGKAAILEIYLNKIFLGHGAYGVRAAASRYFDKHLDELTLAEAALIAGLAQAPSRWSPVNNPELAMRRRNLVLEDMVEAGYLAREQADAAQREPIVLASTRDPFRWRAPFYAEHVRQVVEQQLGADALLTEGLIIESAANLALEHAAERTVDGAIRKLDRRQGWRGPVANLRQQADREQLRERMRAEYGAAPLADHDRWILGLVTEVNRNDAQVDLGSVVAHLSVAEARWAAPYDRRTGINDQLTNALTDVLELGDVVWVRPVIREGAIATHETSGAPMVELGQTPLVVAVDRSLDERSLAELVPRRAAGLVGCDRTLADHRAHP